MTNISRRQVLQLAAASGAISICPFESAYAHPNGYKSRLPAVVDASENLTSAAVSLKARGVKAVIRYYALELQRNLPEKIITKSEANAIFQADLSLAISYQYNNGSIDSFTSQRANLDASMCVKLADNIGQPRDTAVYFGVDKNWIEDQQINAIAEYFKILSDHVEFNNRGLRVGVYGSGFTCDWIKKRSVAQFFWIAGMSDSWNDRAKFMKSQEWNMYQNALEVAAEPTRNDTRRIDTNIVNPKAGFIGSFSRLKVGPDAGKIAVDGVIDNNEALEIHRVANKDTALYKNVNGTDEIKIIKESKIVSVVGHAGQLLMVDAPRQIPKYPNKPKNKEKIADFQRGYCKMSDLSKIDEFRN